MIEIMKRFDSLYLRVAAVLLLGLLAAQWVAERLYREEREKVVSHLISGPLGQRLNLVADKLERLPQLERPEMLQVLNSPRIRFVLAAAPLPDVAPKALQPLQARLGEVMGAKRAVRVAPGGSDSVRVQFTLSDGQSVIATHRNSDNAGDIPSRHLPLLTGYFLAIAVLALLAMRWVVRPLQRLARAADALGRDLSGPPLPETGPREVRQAAHAFNTMQNRLASYLDDRLHILAAVSHDLKTPITRLKLRAEMLPEQGLPATVQRDRFIRDLDEMETLIGASLDFLRGESRQERTAPLDINALLASLRDDLAEVGETIEIKGAAEQPLLARPQALKRCLANLLENAVRYGNRVCVIVQDSAQELLVLIDDSGPGIPEDKLELMFEPFRRGEASRNRATGGIGLGLAIARNLARAHGGDVSLSNRPEGGLRASVRLPRG